MTASHPLVVLVGPTGVGKSAVAMALARELQGEILAADSMQVYRGMDCGTAKPSSADRATIPHHGLDLVESAIEFTVAMYRRYAVTTLQAIRARGRFPIMVGGTGLYVRAVVDGLCAAPPGDAAYRDRLKAQVARDGAAALYGALQITDPIVAARVHPHDVRRIIRALEVYHVSGRPLSQWQGETTGLDATWGIRQVGLIRPRDELYARIDARVDAMVAEGLIEEARACYQRGVGRTAGQALGYQQLFQAFEGRWSVDEAIERLRRDTRRYAKRQLTWFRQDPRITWLTLEAGESPTTAAARVRSLLAH